MMSDFFDDQYNYVDLKHNSKGIDKSSLFKVISGAWQYGHGKVALPSNRTLLFLPQNPTIANDTLKGVLAYPEPASRYSHDQHKHVLTTLGGLDALVARLDEFNHWSSILSGGQKQKISIARALLKKPDWLFLDESTSALDENSENTAYEAIKALKTTTFVSIAHRASVAKFHHKTLFFNANQDKGGDEALCPGIG